MIDEITVMRAKNGFILRPVPEDSRCSTLHKTEVANSPDDIAALVKKWASSSNGEKQ